MALSIRIARIAGTRRQLLAFGADLVAIDVRTKTRTASQAYESGRKFDISTLGF
jgi:hypothetical protein